MRSQARCSLRRSSSPARWSVSDGSADISGGFSLGSGSRWHAAASNASTTPSSKIESTCVASTNRWPSPPRITSPSKMSMAGSPRMWLTFPTSSPSRERTGAPASRTFHEIGAPPSIRSRAAGSAAPWQHRRRAVGDLRGVARGDLAVLLERRLQRGQLLQRGVGARPLVLGVRVAVDLEGDDLAVEAPLLHGPRGQLVGTQAQLVQLRARDLPLVGDHLGAQALRNEVVALEQ